MKPRKIVYFLGAGASKYHNVPDTREFLDIIDSEADNPSESIHEFTKDSKYYKLYSDLFDFYELYQEHVDIEYIYSRLRNFWTDMKEIQFTDESTIHFLLYFFDNLLSKYGDDFIWTNSQEHQGHTGPG